jgi:glycosyltransferase involved in cell wall biosynthesis
VRVSVIVPVRDRRGLLAELLDSLAAQTFRDFEVVVVDDGSVDGSLEEAARHRPGLERVIVMQAGGAGAVAARCLGISRAEGEILAFTDSDCRPVPDWLARGTAAIDAGSDLVSGRTRPPRPLNPLERSMSSGREGLYPTCNLFVRKDAYLRSGGFERSAERRLGFRWGRAKGLGFGEDTILAWRIIRSGGAATYEPEALVEHAIFPARTAELPGRALQGGAFPALVREVPELRETLIVNRIFLGSRRRVPFYATVLAVAARRRAWAAMAAGWWFVARAVDVRPAPVPMFEKIALVLGEMTTDAILGSALVLGSARTGTPVL